MTFKDLRPGETFRLKVGTRHYRKEVPFVIEYGDREYHMNAVTAHFPHWAKHFEDTTPVVVVAV